MIDIEIATYWNVETLYYVLNGVAAIMGGAGFAGVLKTVFMFGLVIGLFAYAGKQLEMAKWFIQAMIFTTLLNLPIARVMLTDRAGLEPPRVVDNVPIALATVAQTTNLVFGWTTRTYETVFGVPEELGLQQGDLAFGHRILRNVNKATIRDPGLRADLMQFIKECTLYDVRDGVIRPDDIIGKTDTWNTMFDNTSPARYVTYNTLTPTPVTDVCTNVAIVLKGRVTEGLESAQAFYGRQNFSRADSDGLASAMFAGSVATSYDWLLTSSQTASDAMKQAMFNNLWREAGSELPALLNDTARIQELQAMSSSAQAARQADGSNSTLSMLAQETLPHMRNWLEALIYAAFPIIVVLMIVVSAESAKKVLAGYMMSLVWVGLWPVMFAVINHLSLMHLRHKMAALKLAEGVPFQLSDVFDATLGSEQAAIGYMVVLVPFLAGALIKTAQGQFMGAADKMIAGFSSVGAAAGSSGASGNISMGQAGIDTASVNSTSMQKFDNNIGMSGGGATIGMASGGSQTIAANGAVALQQMRNHLLTSYSASNNWQSDVARDSHSTQVTGSGSQIQNRSSDSATLTNLKSADRSSGSNQHIGSQARYSVSGSETGSVGRDEGLNRSHVAASRFTQGVGAADALGMAGSVGSRTGGGQPTRGGAGAGAGEQGTPSDAGRRSGASKGPKAGAVEAERYVTDDYGNLVQVAGRTEAPTGKRAEPTVAPGGKTRSTQAGSAFSASLNAQSQVTFSAQHGRDKSVTDAHQVGESANQRRNYSISGDRATTLQTGDVSAQGNRQVIDAARTNVSERSTTRDASSRQEQGLGDRASVSRSTGYSTQHDLASDPNILAKVAKRNNMSAVRFAGQDAGRIQDMLEEYVAEKRAAAGVTSMASTGLSGNSLPSSPEELQKNYAGSAASLPNRIDAKHTANVGKTGYSGTEALEPNTNAPRIFEAARREVSTALDPAVNGSLPKRAEAHDENTYGFASPDKELGAGRANALAMVEASEGEAAKDTILKLKDKLTGGDGMADGETLNDNKRRSTHAPLDIKNPGKK